MKFSLLQKESRTSRNANYQALVGYAIEQITAPAAVVKPGRGTDADI